MCTVFSSNLFFLGTTPPKEIIAVFWLKFLLWEVSEVNILTQITFRELTYSSRTFPQVFRRNFCQRPTFLSRVLHGSGADFYLK